MKKGLLLMGLLLTTTIGMWGQKFGFTIDSIQVTSPFECKAYHQTVKPLMAGNQTLPEDNWHIPVATTDTKLHFCLSLRNSQDSNPTIELSVNGQTWAVDNTVCIEDKVSFDCEQTLDGENSYTASLKINNSSSSFVIKTYKAATGEVINGNTLKAESEDEDNSSYEWVVENEDGKEMGRYTESEKELKENEGYEDGATYNYKLTITYNNNDIELEYTYEGSFTYQKPTEVTEDPKIGQINLKVGEQDFSPLQDGTTWHVAEGSSLTLNATVNMPQGNDNYLFYAVLDDEEGVTVSPSDNNLSWSCNSLSAGEHTFKFLVRNGNDLAESSITIVVHKTGVTLKTPKGDFINGKDVEDIEKLDTINIYNTSLILSVNPKTDFGNWNYEWSVNGNTIENSNSEYVIKLEEWERVDTIRVKVSHSVSEDIIWEDSTYIYKFKFSIPNISSITPKSSMVYKIPEREEYHLPKGETVDYVVIIDGPSEDELKLKNFVYTLAINGNNSKSLSIDENRMYSFTDHLVSDDEEVEARVYLSEGETPIQSYSIKMNVHSYPGLDEKSTEGFNDDEETTYYQDDKNFIIAVKYDKGLEGLEGKWAYDWAVDDKDGNPLDLNGVGKNDSIFTLSKNNIDYDSLYTIKAKLVYKLTNQNNESDGQKEQEIKWFNNTYSYKVKLSQTKINEIFPSLNGNAKKDSNGNFHVLLDKGCNVSYTIHVNPKTLPEDEEWVGSYSFNDDAVEITKEDLKEDSVIVTNDYTVEEGINILKVKINNSEERQLTIFAYKYDIPENEDVITVEHGDISHDITDNQITFSANGASIKPIGGEWRYDWEVIDPEGRSLLSIENSITITENNITIKAYKDVDYEKDYKVKLTATYLPDPANEELKLIEIPKEYTIRFKKPVLTVESDLVTNEEKSVILDDGKKHVLQGTIVKHIVKVEGSLPEGTSATYTFVSQNSGDIEYDEEKKEFSIEEELDETGEYTFKFYIVFDSLTCDTTYVVHEAPTIDAYGVMSEDIPSDTWEIKKNKMDITVKTTSTDIGEWSYEWYEGYSLIEDQKDSIITIKAFFEAPYDSPIIVKLKPKYIIKDKNGKDVDWSPKDTLYCEFLFVKPELEVKCTVDYTAKAFSSKDATYALEGESGTKVTYEISLKDGFELPEDWNKYSTYSFVNEENEDDNKKGKMGNERYERTLKEGSYIFSVDILNGVFEESQIIRVCKEPEMKITEALTTDEKVQPVTLVEEDVKLQIATNQPKYGEWKYTWAVNGKTSLDEEITLNAGDGNDFGLVYGTEYLITLNVSYEIDGEPIEEWFEPATYYYRVIFKQSSDKIKVNIAAIQKVELANGQTAPYTLETKDEDVVSGQPIELTIDKNPSQWTWYWMDDKNNTIDGSKNESTYLYTPSAVDSMEVKTLTIHIEPTDQSIMPNESYKVSFHVWPEPMEVDDWQLELKDALNQNNDMTKGIREGNGVKYNPNMPYSGGYAEDEATTWFADLQGEESLKNVTKPTEVKLAYVVTNKKGDRVMWEKKVEEHTLTVYPKPALPKSVIMKGNGRSNTWIVDSYPSGIDGIVASKGEPKTTIGNGEELHDGGNNMKWFRPQEKADESDMRIYSVKRYDNDGVIITSDLLPAGKNKPEELWDGSVYNASGTRWAMEQQTPANAPEGNYTIHGMKTDHMVRGLNIIRMEDGTVKKVFK